MRRKILSIGLLGVVMASLAVVTAPTPAQATVTRAAAAVVRPSTSPVVENFAYDGFVPVCPTGYACALVIVDGDREWRHYFQFYNYGYYNLSNWLDWGYAINRQTGGAAMRLYSGSTQIQCIPPGNQPLVNWYPVTRIRLTSSPC
jgi:hypothetical protein